MKLQMNIHLVHNLEFNKCFLSIKKQRLTLVTQSKKIRFFWLERTRCYSYTFHKDFCQMAWYSFLLFINITASYLARIGYFQNISIKELLKYRIWIRNWIKTLTRHGSFRKSSHRKSSYCGTYFSTSVHRGETSPPPRITQFRKLDACCMQRSPQSTELGWEKKYVKTL